MAERQQRESAVGLVVAVMLVMLAAAALLTYQPRTGGVYPTGASMSALGQAGR